MAAAVDQGEKGRSVTTPALYPQHARRLIECLPNELNNAIFDCLGDEEVTQKLRLVGYGVRTYVDVQYYRLQRRSVREWDPEDTPRVACAVVEALRSPRSSQYFFVQQAFRLNEKLRATLRSPHLLRHVQEELEGLRFQQLLRGHRRQEAQVFPVARMCRPDPDTTLRFNGLLRGTTAVASDRCGGEDEWNSFFTAKLQERFAHLAFHTGISTRCTQWTKDKELANLSLAAHYVKSIVPQADLDEDVLDKVRFEALLPAKVETASPWLLGFRFRAFYAANRFLPHCMRDLCRAMSLSALRSPACPLWQQFDFRDYERAVHSGYESPRLRPLKTRLDVQQAGEYFTAMLVTAAPKIDSPTSYEACARCARKFWPRLLAHITLRVQAKNEAAQQALFTRLFDKTCAPSPSPPRQSL
jgi:hypothetical protein